MHVLDPSHEVTPVGVQPASRLASLEGKTVGFISNGKEGTTGFFKHLSDILRADFGVADVQLAVKSNYSAPADSYILQDARNWDAVVTGLGD
jgi:hypothetical protein